VPAVAVDKTNRIVHVQVEDGGSCFPFVSGSVVSLHISSEDRRDYVGDVVGVPVRRFQPVGPQFGPTFSCEATHLSWAGFRAVGLESGERVRVSCQRRFPIGSKPSLVREWVWGTVVSDYVVSVLNNLTPPSGWTPYSFFEDCGSAHFAYVPACAVERVSAVVVVPMVSLVCAEGVSVTVTPAITHSAERLLSLCVAIGECATALCSSAEVDQEGAAPPQLGSCVERGGCDTTSSVQHPCGSIGAGVEKSESRGGGFTLGIANLVPDTGWSSGHTVDCPRSWREIYYRPDRTTPGLTYAEIAWEKCWGDCRFAPNARYSVG